MASYRAGEGYREIDSGAGRTCESAARLGAASAFVRTVGSRGRPWEGSRERRVQDNLMGYNNDKHSYRVSQIYLNISFELIFLGQMY